MTATVPTLTSQYDPSATEGKWQQAWEAQQVFRADPAQGGDPYCIVIPPPNVTGSLHMGHAFESALIDVLVRYHRMAGRNTLWLPGTDHASIAVHTILEQQLAAEGLTRQDISREQFLERAWNWKAESGGKIVNQLRRLGVSVDWSRQRFTLDEGLSKAVIEVFVRLHEEGLIYRGNYLVNWCPASQSAVSDLEVENREVDGHLWHLRYPLTDGSGHVEVATTRPETMLGDTAVAVNPEDDRYRHLIGKTLTLPIMNREIPIIGDAFVDPSFGTGCVKVTPAHDPNDFEMGQRHNLPMISVMHKDGRLNENAGPFAGRDRFEARQDVVDWLEGEGFLVKVEDYRHSVPYSDRGKVPVEPMISTQWFVKIDPLAQQTLTWLDQQNSPHFIPDRWRKVYRDWLVNLRDWCISRQLWWGHQIPAWYAVSETEGEIREHTPFVVARTAQEARDKAVAQFGEVVQLEQDPDVLDTWFSSGLWPFSTLGWPDHTEDLEFYYPTSTLVTGFDIIFFWVARMTLMGSHFTGSMPFQDVYIHGLVRDEKNQKMSKSKGNGIDPLVLIEKYGTDALRYTLVREVVGAGQDIRLDYDRKTDESSSVEASRNFANKLWNASRFVLLNLKGQTPAQLGEPAAVDLELCDRWILTRYARLVSQTQESIAQYSLGEAAKGLYEFIWGDLCDWYIELVKPRLREESPSGRVAQQTLAYVLEGTLRLLHPFMPHITEEIWQTLTQAPDHTFLALQAYPTLGGILTHLHAPPQSQGRSVASPPDEAAPSVTDLLKDLPSFTQKYQRSLVWLLGLGILILVLSTLASAISTLNHVPLLGRLLEIIGLGATLVFAARKLLWQTDRQHFLQSVLAQKDLILDRMQHAEALSPASAETGATAQASAPIASEMETQFALILETIRTVRNLRAEANIKPSLHISVILQSDNPEERQILTQGRTYILDAARVESLQITDTVPETLKQTLVGVVDTVQVLVPLSGVVDLETLRAKVEKDLARAEADVNALQGRLGNQKFVENAPAEIVQGARDALAEAQKQSEILRDRLQQLQE
ncbi:valine--tRNA ligase [Lyngbya confervoides]|uniref:Valine--tRNA ligase n=1 Tax=Lyngbya confervoides BDU141951 TaxID=1574623 RepID=A0ABD4T8Q9_9CYAN|nr:valine--tRNA ligase [Lyngbya confervoides]MCM1984885.1 valine--tRNA ligase [Lyngbya confervoides BDU141951]